MSDSLRRGLGLLLLDQFRRRGELLALAAQQSKETVRLVLVEHHIQYDEAIHYILVHLFWADVRRAEQWSHRRGQPPPSTVAEAVTMLIHWHATGLSNMPEEESHDDA